MKVNEKLECLICERVNLLFLVNQMNDVVKGSLEMRNKDGMYIKQLSYGFRRI